MLPTASSDPPLFCCGQHRKDRGGSCGACAEQNRYHHRRYWPLRPSVFSGSWQLGTELCDLDFVPPEGGFENVGVCHLPAVYPSSNVGVKPGEFRIPCFL